MKEKEITHTGMVSSIADGMVNVSVEASSACAGCHAKGSCTMSDTTEKMIQVRQDEYANLHVGEEVTVIISRDTGIFAVTMAYIFPVVLIVLSLWGFGALGFNELITFSIMIATVTLYYILLYGIRKKLIKRINIKIKK